jgi:GNAT superfamily N-acetyltransferase
MLIRVACEADITEMHRIRMSVRENRLADASLIQPHDYRALLDGLGRGWVAAVDGRIVGFAVADLARRNVWALFVDPKAEGLGAGRRLHEAMMDWMFASGAAEVWLSTDPGTRAERFYRSAGWRFAGSQPDGENRYEMTREQWEGRARS